MKVIYVVEAHGTLCGCVVSQIYAIESRASLSRRKLEQACRDDLQESARFDDVWDVRLRFSLRLTLMRYLNRRKFLSILHRVDRW